jgi:hypothetical protein
LNPPQAGPKDPGRAAARGPGAARDASTALKSAEAEGVAFGFQLESG